jgi:glyoxalase family protein
MPGIHHVTAISGKAERNVAFYAHVLGLRLVKRTVNFDDPGTYHLYYGDEAGRPGTILTFFPWEHAAAGRAGVGSAQSTAFRVPLSSIGYWTQHFVAQGVAHETLEKRFGESVVPLAPRASRDGATATFPSSTPSAAFTAWPSWSRTPHARAPC